MTPIAPTVPGNEAVPGWRHPVTWLGLALGLMLAAQVGWLILNQRPVEYDAAWYMETAISLKRLLVERGPAAFLEGARGAFKFKAPGVSMAAALAMAVLGESTGRAISPSLAAWLVTAAYVYLLGRRYLTAEAAAMAALLASAAPISFSLSRSLLVESSLTAAAVAFLFHAVASERLSRWGHLLALAAWGTAGLMVKATFPAYVVLPALFLTLTPWTEARPRAVRTIAAWALVATAAVGAAAWLWYAENWRTVLAFIRDAAYGPAALPYAVSVPAFLVSALVHASSPWTVLSLVALLVAAALRDWSGVARRPLLLSTVWLAPALAMVLSSSNRYGRYLSAALPALALAVGTLAEPWLRRSSRTAALTVALLAGPPLAYFVVTTVPTPFTERVRGFVAERSIGGGNQYEEPPDGRPWPNAGIIAAAAHALGDDRAVLLRLNVDLPALNHNNLRLEAVLQRVEVFPASIDQSSPESAVVTSLTGDLLLLQSGGEVATDFLNLQRAAVAGELATGRHPYHLVARFELPGGRQVALLARRCVVEDTPSGGPPMATMERGVELLSVEAARSAARMVSVRTRYRASSNTHPLLGVQVELAGPDGKALSRGEHPLCRQPPRLWPMGTAIEDTFFMSMEAVERGLVLRVGLQDRLTGVPLRVERVAAGVGSSDGTAVVIPGWSVGLGRSSAP